MYIHPFAITNEMLNRISNIMANITKLDLYNSLSITPMLRRNNKIKSIYSSLAIEANSLSLNQVRDIINGKLVLGPANEIKEVKNAINAYDLIDKYNCFLEEDLIKAHNILTHELVSEERYRNHPEGVFDGERVIFIAPPHDLVPKLMNDLFNWLIEDKDTHPIIKSCIFHYEFVFIHPFSDGNGRTARLWQNVILSNYNKQFKYLPIESQIINYQEDYYNVINKCNHNGDSTLFIEFMLQMIDNSLSELLLTFNKESKTINSSVNKLLDVMEYGITYSAIELMEKLNIKSRDTLRNSYLTPALDNGLISRTIIDKPNSKNQRYIKN